MERTEQIEQIIDALKEDVDELFHKTKNKTEKLNTIKWIKIQIEVLKTLLFKEENKIKTEEN